ncbi:MAG: hypothetical protein IPG19_09565 [Burkholderiales bacterium]|nr:hypothetical protein [Burkholderiales bacterium]
MAQRSWFSLFDYGFNRCKQVVIGLDIDTFTIALHQFYRARQARSDGMKARCGTFVLYHPARSTDGWLV